MIKGTISSVLSIDEYKKAKGIENLYIVLIEYGQTTEVGATPDSNSVNINILFDTHAKERIIKSTPLNKQSFFVITVECSRDNTYTRIADLDDLRDYYSNSGKYVTVDPFNEKYFFSRVSIVPLGPDGRARWGIINIHGHEIVSPSFDSISDLNDYDRDFETVFLTNLGLDREFKLGEISSGVLTPEPDDKNLSRCSFREFLWRNGLFPSFEIRRKGNGHEYLVFDNGLEIIVGKTLDYKCPISLETLLVNTCVLTNECSNDVGSPKYFLYKPLGVLLYMDDYGSGKYDPFNDLEVVELYQHLYPLISWKRYDENGNLIGSLIRNYNPNGQMIASYDRLAFIYDLGVKVMISDFSKMVSIESITIPRMDDFAIDENGYEYYRSNIRVSCQSYSDPDRTYHFTIRFILRYYGQVEKLSKLRLEMYWIELGGVNGPPERWITIKDWDDSEVFSLKSYSYEGWVSLDDFQDDKDHCEIFNGN